MAHLVSWLGISSDLVDRSDTGLYMGYRKYKAIVAAIHAASEITWEVKKPTDTEIIECFVAKSSFYKISDTSNMFQTIPICRNGWRTMMMHPQV